MNPQIGDRVRCINPQYRGCHGRAGTVEHVRDDRPDSGEIIVTVNLDTIIGLDNGSVDVYHDDLIPLGSGDHAD